MVGLKTTQHVGAEGAKTLSSSATAKMSIMCAAQICAGPRRLQVRGEQLSAGPDCASATVVRNCRLAAERSNLARSQIATLWPLQVRVSRFQQVASRSSVPSPRLLGCQLSKIVNECSTKHLILLCTPTSSINSNSQSDSSRIQRPRCLAIVGSSLESMALLSAGFELLTVSWHLPPSSQTFE